MRFKVTYLVFTVLLFITHAAVAQVPGRRNPGNLQLDPNGQPLSTDSRGNPVNPNRRADTTLKHRDHSEDSITIYFRYLDSTRTQFLDSSLTDFNRRFVTPYYYYNLGNLGLHAKSYLFNPILKPGFDAGFHSLDLYKFTIEGTKIYQTTRPFTQINYVIGSKAEQTAHITFTQNRKDNVNYGFEYRFINGPGNMRSQKTGHNNFRFHLYYQSPNRKYTAYFIYLSNKLKASANGGLINESQLEDENLSFNDPFEYNTRLGQNSGNSRNPFNTFIPTGNEYRENTLFFRHHYDLGQKDSIVTDSVTYKVFYPRFRLQHQISYNAQRYGFSDNGVDSAAYKDYFNYHIDSATVTSKSFQDRWRILNNEFSLISFPEKNNLSQFIKLGAAVEVITGLLDTVGKQSEFNTYLLGEYRNRTRNKIWDIEANGKLYVAGYNNADYSLYATLQRRIGKNNYLRVGFQNVNRRPSQIYYGITDFKVNKLADAKKENTTKIFASTGDARLKLNVTGEYYLLSNYTYFNNFYDAKQEGKLFHMLHVFAEKQFKISRRLTVYTEAHLQQTTGDAPVNVPLFFTRNRLVHEGNYYKNLFLAFGTEIKYNTPFNADNFSPLNAQFNVQDSVKISNLPQVDIFLNFRIRTFKAFIRYDNLTSFVRKYSYNAPLYLNPEGIFRLGIFWDFVN